MEEHVEIVMNKRWNYLKYVLRHKYLVFKHGLQLGVPFYRLIIHDWHKFLPSEWFPYVEWFYGYNGGSWYQLKKQFKEHPEWCGPYGKLCLAKEAFDYAWLLHQKRAPHHWQRWVLLNDSDGMKLLSMKDSYRREMLADWMAMGDVKTWYQNNKEKMSLHAETRIWIEKMLSL